MKKKLILSSAALFIAFIFFSYLVHRDYFTRLDFDTTIRLQDHISRRFDSFFSWLSVIGRVEIMGILIAIIGLVFFRLRGIIVIFLFALFHIFELYGKIFVKHLPPPHFLLRTELIGNFPKYYVNPENSYPSGHAARALFITLIIGFVLQKSIKISNTQKYIIYICLGIYDITMLISRIYLGEHWTSDVIGGILLGSTFAFLSLVFV